MEECLGITGKHKGENKVAVKKKYRVLRRMFIDADPLQMKELFNNILSNAYDAMRGKEGNIEIEARREEKNVRIFIKDNGIGMDKELLRRAHEPFFTTKAKGTGLGLMVCFQIVSLHEGRLELSSEKGKGTLVSVALPIKRRPENG